MRFHLGSSLLATVGTAAVLTAVGCGGQQKSTTEPATYSAQYQAELQEERQEFVNDSQERLNEIDNKIARLETRLQYESPYVDSDKRAERSQQLFEAKLQRNELQSKLQRASTASPQEWEEMRGTMGRQLDRVDAAVGQLEVEVDEVFGGD